MASSGMKGFKTPKGWQGGRTVGRMISGKDKKSSGERSKASPTKNARIPSKRERFPFGKYRPSHIELNADGSWKTPKK